MEKPVSINVRLPKPLHERIVERANEDIRSVNSEIQWLLTLALDRLDEEAKWRHS
jgi:hypothetical protein